MLVRNTAFQQNNAKTRQAIALLGRKLQEIVTFCMSDENIGKLKTVPIFVDWNTSGGTAVYRPNLAWLLANGYIASHLSPGFALLAKLPYFGPLDYTAYAPDYLNRRAPACEPPFLPPKRPGLSMGRMDE